MRKRTPRVLILAYIYVVGFTLCATGQAALKLNEPLVPCELALHANVAEVHQLPHSLMGLLAEYTITDLRDFQGHQLIRSGGALRQSPAPDLIFNSKKWRRERWSVGAEDYWFYDVGFRNLENDAADLNAAVLAQVMTNPGESHVFTSSEARRRDLRNLHRFRLALHGRVVKQYLEDLARNPYLSESLAALDESAHLNTNVEVFGILNHRLDWDADAEDVMNHTVMTVQISFDEHAEYFRPDVFGMLQQLGIKVGRPVPLPFMLRLVEGRATANFMKEYDETFGKDRVCEIARYLKAIKNLAAPLKNRLLYEVFNRARQRGCTVLVASVKDSTARLFEMYGFQKFRAMPTGTSKREYLTYLLVDSPEFIKANAHFITSHAGLNFDRSSTPNAGDARDAE